MGDHILVIGATLLDTKGKPMAGLQPGTSNPGHIRHTWGGTARNVAENLGHLGATVILLSAVGDDETGFHLLDRTAAAGVNVDYIVQAAGQRTGAYIALLETDGSLAVALDDVSVMKAVTGAHLYKNRRLFRDAQMIMFDSSLSPEAIQTAVNLALRYHVPLCADPSSARLANKLIPHLPYLRLVAPNEVEAAALLGRDHPGSSQDTSLEMALALRQRGIEIALITLPDYSLVYATSDETGYIPVRASEMVDSTGAGDALMAATMFGLVNEMSVIESIRLGAAAASLTLQTSHTVVHDLSLDMLYDHLVI